MNLQIGDRGYNGWTVGELADTAGMKRLGVETVPQIVTRGLLIDVPAGRGTDRLEYLAGEPGPGYELLDGRR